MSQIRRTDTSSSLSESTQPLIKYSKRNNQNPGSRESLLPYQLVNIEMASPEIHHLFHSPIADHSFSQDKSTLAVARDSNVELYQLSGNKFTLKDELRGHDKTVTGVDIAPNSGRIVTCSQGKFLTTKMVQRFFKANEHMLCRPKCLCLGANGNRLEAYACASPNQSCCDICPMVPLRAKVCCRLWSSSNRSVLLRRRE